MLIRLVDELNDAIRIIAINLFKVANTVLIIVIELDIVVKTSVIELNIWLIVPPAETVKVGLHLVFSHIIGFLRKPLEILVNHFLVAATAMLRSFAIVWRRGSARFKNGLARSERATKL